MSFKFMFKVGVYYLTLNNYVLSMYAEDSPTYFNLKGCHKNSHLCQESTVLKINAVHFLPKWVLRPPKK